MGYNPPLISGPIAPESNPPINPQFYQPSVFQIGSLTYGPTTIVTTTQDQNYTIGQQVRLLIPFGFGAYQLNEKQGVVINVISSTQVEVTIDSTNADPFNPSFAFSNTPPQIVAIGDVNSGQINSAGRIQNKTYILGSFINISPL